MTAFYKNIPVDWNWLYFGHVKAFAETTVDRRGVLYCGQDEFVIVLDF